MKTWCHLPFRFSYRYALLALVFSLLGMSSIALLAPLGVSAKASTNRTISFQGRLLTTSGKAVPDGNYNIQFKIYKSGNGASAGDPSGTLEWTETYLNKDRDDGVNVMGGLFSVELGSNNPFGSQVDWDSSSLWLSINVAGKANACRNFNAKPCQADGEMLPMRPITATPYALSAGAVGGKTADDLVQLGQGKQTDSSNTSSVFINKTGSGNLIQLQNNGSDTFTVSNSGSLNLGGDSSKAISVNTAAANTKGQQLTIAAGSGGNGLGANGGNLVLDGGAAGGDNASGGDIVLNGGAGNGDGTKGLVILGTPTFSAVTNDSQCYTDGMIVRASCTISQVSVDSSSTILAGFSTDGQTAKLPNPTNQTAGRLIYIIAASDSHEFTLDAGHNHKIQLQPNTAVAIIWSGSSWASVTGTDAPNIQGSSNGPTKSPAESKLPITGGPSAKGLTIDNSNPQSIEQASLDGSSLIVGDQATKDGELASDGNVQDSKNFPSNWLSIGNSAASRNISNGQTGDDSAQVTTSTAPGDGIRNQISANPRANSNYRVSVYAKLVNGSSFNDFEIKYTPDGGASFTKCTNYSSQKVTSKTWAHITCNITMTADVATNPYLDLVQPTSPDTARTFLVDSLSFKLSSNVTPNIKVKPSVKDEQAASPTKPSSTSSSDDNAALLGSMYYDADKGKVQCYNTDGWGDCQDAPDAFVTLSPQYSNAVMNGADIGTISSDLCSDTLNINDGSKEQPDVCGTNETYNFYKWSSKEDSDQTRSIFVTYQLPSNFKNFASGATTLLGRTDSENSAVTYRIYRDDGKSGLTACGDNIKVSTDTQTSWKKVAATGNADPSSCDFKAGDSILFRIDLTAKDKANAYVSNLSFVYGSQ